MDNKNISQFIETSNNYYQDLLGYKPGKTSLEQVQKNQWKNFCQKQNLNQNSSGVYLPRNQTAIIQEENPLSLFHEYFGHGLFCERTQKGKRLVDLEKKLLEEETEFFNGREFTLEDLKKFREQSKTFKGLNEFRNQNLVQYELFAVWTEYLLSKENGLREVFERKYDKLFSEDKEQVDNIINFSEQYGNLATFYANGLARRTTPTRVKRLLEEIYGSKLGDVKFALLYGSIKPYSDIDIFAISDNLSKIKNHWIDVNVMNQNEFEKRINLFDVEITDPVSTGEFVVGDEKYLRQKRKQLIEQPITKEAIKYNLREAEKQERFAYQYPEEFEERRVGLSYALTSRLMAENLRQGRRVFIKEDLLLCSQNEKFIELKGGIEE